jgi:hypothetical protein
MTTGLGRRVRQLERQQHLRRDQIADGRSAREELLRRLDAIHARTLTSGEDPPEPTPQTTAALREYFRERFGARHPVKAALATSLRI